MKRVCLSALLAVELLVGCSGERSSTTPDMVAPGPAQAPTLDFSLASSDGGFAADAAVAGDLGQTSYRTSLSTCWRDVTCQRALLIAHGGAWSTVDPAYGSSAAFEDAYDDDADAIKADLRFSKDGVPVVVHSSPFASYEIDPLDFSCLGATVEKMNASDIVKCQWVNGDHVQTLAQLLAWAQGKLVVMLCLKVSSTLPQAIESLVTLGATDFAFLEIDTTTLKNAEVAPDHDKVWYLVEVSNQADIAAMLALNDPRAFMFEDANADNFGGMAASAVTMMISTQLHPAGVRAFTSVSSVSASASTHETLWNEGFDVVMSNSFSAGRTGRVSVNTARGISPP